MTNYEQFGHDIYTRPKQGNSLGLFDYNFPELTIEMLENTFHKKRLRENTPTKKEKVAIQTSLPFWKIYTPSNIIKEVFFRIKTKVH
jgi:hypothetical protein